MKLSLKDTKLRIESLDDVEMFIFILFDTTYFNLFDTYKKVF